MLEGIKYCFLLLAEDAFDHFDLFFVPLPRLLQLLHFSFLLFEELFEFGEVLHKHTASLQCSPLHHILRFWEEREQPLEDLLRHAEEGSPLLLHGLGVLLAADLDHEVGSQVEHQLVLAEEGVLRQLQERRDTLLIIKNRSTTRHEIHLAELLAVLDYGLSWLVDPAIHVDNQLVLESYLSI